MPEHTSPTASNTRSKAGSAPSWRRSAPETLRTVDRILAAVLVPDADPASARDCLAGLSRDGNTDWERLFGLLSAGHLAPLLYHRLRDFGLLESVPPAIRDRLHESFRANQIRNHLYREELLGIARRLAQGGREAVLLKGAAGLFQKPYEHPAIRVMHDLDLFVSPDDRKAAREILARMGYRLLGSERRHDIYLQPRRDIRIEVHHRPLDAFLAREDADALNRRYWSRRTPLAEGPRSLFTLAPEDSLFFHIYHAAVHHTCWIYESPYTLLEFIVLNRLHGGARVVDGLLEEAVRVGLAPFFLTFLHILKEKTGWQDGAPPPLPQRHREALELFIRRETLAPAMHGLHIRRLILGGFEEGAGRRCRRLLQMALLDIGDLREAALARFGARPRGASF